MTSCSVLLKSSGPSRKRDSKRVAKKRQLGERSFQSAPQQHSQRTRRSEINFPGDVCFRVHALQSLIHPFWRSSDTDVRELTLCENVNKLQRSFGSVWNEIYSFGIYSAVIIYPPVESRGLDQQSLRWPSDDPQPSDQLWFRCLSLRCSHYCNN